MILNENSDPVKVLEYMTDLKEKVTIQQRDASNVSKYQRLFRLPEHKFDDLEDTANEIELKRLLWEVEH